MPKIQFLYEDYWFEVLPEHYILEMGDDNCGLCFNESKDDMWILGDVFMRGWYHIHDFENKRQGFVPTKLTSKRAPYKETTKKI